jgi:FkbM family methyltransferase
MRIHRWSSEIGTVFFYLFTPIKKNPQLCPILPLLIRKRSEELSRMLTKAIDKISRMSVVDQDKLGPLFEQSHLRRLLCELNADCVFDIGANAGQYATMLRRKAHYSGRIISFEPLPRECGALKELSRDDELWDIDQSGVTARGGLQSFHVMASSQFSSFSGASIKDTDLFLNSNRVERTIPVETVTLDFAYEKYHQKFGFKRPFLKLDTQGLDTEILRDNRAVLQNFVGFQSELSIKKLYDKSIDFRDAITLYEKLGFELSALVPNNAGHFPVLVEIDCIMIRRDLFQKYLRAA